ncbi:MAG: Hint domain-containing protein [Pseudomonadota bacterium]
MATVNGSSGDDFVAGTDGTVGDEIYAGDGSDNVEGRDGNDTIFGGSGNDMLLGYDGATASSGDTVMGDDDGSDDTLFGGSGTDTLAGGDGADRLFGGDDGDSLYGNNDDDALSGGGGADSLDGGAGNDALYGGAGDDVLTDTAGENILDGGQGNDSITAGDDTAFIRGGFGNDTIQTGAGDDTLMGSDGTDAVSTAVSEDFDDLSGVTQYQDSTFAVNDSLGSPTGNTALVFTSDNTEDAGNFGGVRLDVDTDTLNVGAEYRLSFWARTDGPDQELTLSYQSGLGGPQEFVSNTVTATNDWQFFEFRGTLDEAHDRLFIWSEVGNATFAVDAVRFEEIEPTADDDSMDAGAGDDLVYAAEGNDTVDGGAGNDTIIAGTGNDSAAGGDGSDVIYGGEGNDTLSTGIGNDTLFGGVGDDVLTNSAGNDTLFGGAGDDSIVASLGDDTLYGGDGNDALFGGEDEDLLFGGAGNDELDGGIGNDTMFGGNGNDEIYGADGADSIDAGNGDDTIYAGNGDDLIDGEQGDDIVYAGDGNDTIAETGGNFSEDTIYGGDGNDQVDAGSADDTVFGGAGNDSISGGSGDDTLHGGSGDDEIYGGDGRDTVVLEDGFGNDVIYGGEGGTDSDTLDFSGLSTGITVTASGSEQGTATDSSNTLTFAEIEDIVGTSNADIVSFNGHSSAVTIDGGAGNDVVLGSTAADSITGGAGDDLILGGAGNDTLTGGSGNDTFFVQSGDGTDVITDFTAGSDTLDVTSLTDGGGGTVTADEVVVTGGGGSDQILTFPNGESIAVPDGTVDTSTTATQFASLVSMGVPPCFAPGTKIRTPMGERLVEDLRVGDLVLTADRGAQPLIWIGRRDIDFSRPANPRTAKDKPVEIKAGALGPGLPRNRLVVSPQHRMVLEDETGQQFLGLAKGLTELAGIRVMIGRKSITYYALLLDHHAILFAEGAMTESFRPGSYILSTFSAASRSEIRRVLPGLASDPSSALGPPSRPILTRRATKRLAEQLKLRLRRSEAAPAASRDDAA